MHFKYRMNSSHLDQVLTCKGSQQSRIIMTRQYIGKLLRTGSHKKSRKKGWKEFPELELCFNCWIPFFPFLTIYSKRVWDFQILDFKTDQLKQIIESLISSMSENFEGKNQNQADRLSDLAKDFYMFRYVGNQRRIWLIKKSCLSYLKQTWFRLASLHTLVLFRFRILSGVLFWFLKAWNYLRRSERWQFQVRLLALAALC